MRATEFTETVNDKLFWTGYEKKKEILDGAYVLVASAGYVGYGAKPDHKSTQFRIVARTAKGGDVGWVNFENKDDHLEALDLTIQPAHRRKGIATEMYRFARELGNDIAPSKLQTTKGKQFWHKDHSKEVDEGANRIGTAMWRSSIPPKYKQFKVIGQGATSVVLDKGDGNVLMLTRDNVKKDWLVQDWGLGLGNWIDTFDARHQQSPAISDMPVYVIELPKLQPLSPQNKQVIRKATKEYETIVGYGNDDRRADKFNDYLEKHPDGLFARLLEFLGNYDTSQYGIDFVIRNFMQDQSGNIVLIDPIASKEVTAALRALYSWS